MMEAPLEDESFAAALAGIEGANHGEEQKASDEAITFVAGIEPSELQKCVFSDSLVTVSEGGRNLGKFIVKVEFARRVQQPCLLLHAQSQGAIDGSPCGTTVTAYLTTDLEVLEEDYHEYVKLEGHSLDKRCHMEQRDEQMVIDKVTTAGEEVTKESVSYPMSVLRGLVTEGSNLLLMRLIALRKKVPEHMTFICFDQGVHIAHTTFSELGLKQLEVGGETVEVFGVERIVHSVEDSPTTWQCYFLADGHLASKVQVGSPVTTRLLQLPSQQEKGFEKISLVWEEDMQMRSKFLDRKEELKADHASYLRQHPEIRALISDFLQFLLLRKPDDVFEFVREYFLPFASHLPPEPSEMAPALSAAERQRRYRAKRDADPERRAKYLQKEREKWQQDRETGKKKRLADLTEREKRAQRKMWRERKRNAKKRQKARAAISSPLDTPTGPSPSPVEYTT